MRLIRLEEKDNTVWFSTQARCAAYLNLPVGYLSAYLSKNVANGYIKLRDVTVKFDDNPDIRMQTYCHSNYSDIRHERQQILI